MYYDFYIIPISTKPKENKQLLLIKTSKKIYEGDKLKMD